MRQPGYPLDTYDALDDAVLVDSFHGPFTDIVVFIAYRPLLGQLVVAVSGTSSIKQALQDLRILRRSHPSGRGTVHTGFWTIYKDIKAQAITAIQKGVADYLVREIVLTGHSMGGSIVYLLCLDLFADHQKWLKDLNINIKVVAFGPPRTGDAALVDHFQELSLSYQKIQGQDAFKEYSVKGYNDGRPLIQLIYASLTLSDDELLESLPLEQAYQLFHQHAWVIDIFARNLCIQQAVFCITLLPLSRNTVCST